MSDRPTHPFFDHPTPIPIAHQGGTTERLENTLDAFAHAVALGYRYLDVDVRVSADGVVVAFHDEDLRRLTGRPERIADLTWKELSEVELGAERAPILRLDELLDRWDEHRFLIEIKTLRAVDPLAEVLRSTSAASRVCVAAFSDRTTARLRRAIPDAAQSVGRVGTGLRWLAGLAGLGPGSGADVMHPPLRQELGPFTVTVVTERFVRSAHKAGLRVLPWTIDDPADMAHLIGLGVDGINTGSPTLLRDVLTEAGLWVGS
ncbi:MAG: glycerophosphodiester phosphodiesterase family protein [Actinomycetota bacterium]|nr:glycerophosphodiester phosphodiesterase family protein [Actinomycetota bacterium]